MTKYFSNILVLCLTVLFSACESDQEIMCEEGIGDKEAVSGIGTTAISDVVNKLVIVTIRGQQGDSVHIYIPCTPITHVGSKEIVEFSGEAQMLDPSLFANKGDTVFTVYYTLFNPSVRRPGDKF